MSWKKGASLTPEHRAAISAGLTGIPLTPEHRTSISAGLTGYKKTPEHLANMGAAISIALTGRRRIPRTPDHCRALAEVVARKHERGDYFKGPTSLEFALQMLLESAELEYEAQVRFGRYVTDFWVPSRSLVFEADGMFWSHHQDAEREMRRDAYLRERGVLEVVHLQDDDLEMWRIK